MKLTLKKMREATNCKHELYAIGKYEVDVTIYKEVTSGNPMKNSLKESARYVRVYVSDIEPYIPEIYCIDNFEGEVIRFDIQTTSYGALAPDEIRKVIEGYNEAVKVAEFLTKEFVKI